MIEIGPHLADALKALGTCAVLCMLFWALSK
jgi:hypothetical protein